MLSAVRKKQGCSCFRTEKFDPEKDEPYAIVHGIFIAE